ncbi:hypothetical protein Anas_08178 [Armadillidium nasatum]|uniref:Stathmin-4 n=1 Tax=Armadillidium nasatum TaxID=96803 RepID=A0A5N5TK17_9CRUS|nr:hypothetical protein Anas_08178 [Armadillidium nasatum]
MLIKICTWLMVYLSYLHREMLCQKVGNVFYSSFVSLFILCCFSCGFWVIIGGHFHKKPISKKINKKPRCKQPKKKRYYHATEIRCEEKSRGGMCYEMILAEPIAEKPEPAVGSPKAPKSVTEQDIKMKLLQAEERRKSMEASRLASISERLARLEEAGRKREEANLAFIAATQVALEDKLDAFSINREAHLNNLKTKISEHLTSVEAVRKQLEAQSEELRDAINSKLNSAQENRDEHLRKLMDKLKEHDEYAHQVRQGHQESIRQLDEKITYKLNVAETNRMSEKMKKLELLREHSQKVNEVQENLQKRESEHRELREQAAAAYEEKVKKITEEKAKKQTLNVTAKVEQVLEAKQKEEEENEKRSP